MLKKIAILATLVLSPMVWADNFYEKLNNYKQVQKLSTQQIREYQRYLSVQEWRKIFDGNTFLGYINYQSVEPMNNDLVKAWDRKVYKADDSSQGKYIGDYDLTFNIYDCRKNQSLLLKIMYYDKSGQLKDEFDFSNEGGVDKVFPNTFDAKMLNNACSYGFIKAH